MVEYDGMQNDYIKKPQNKVEGEEWCRIDLCVYLHVHAHEVHAMIAKSAYC